MKIKDLKPAPYNPRKITDEKLKMLDKSMQEYGDLSGIVFNRKTGNLIGGHMRIKNLDPEWEVMKSEVNDKLGTVAEGHIETPFGKWTYREVNWSKKKEKAANVAANKHGGSFDLDGLRDIVKELDVDGFDLDLLGFDEIELNDIFKDFEVPGENKGIDESAMNDTENECPKCGFRW